MLTVDLVLARRRADRLILRKIEGDIKRRALELSSQYLDITKENIGSSKERFEECARTVHVQPSERKLADGLLKLINDRCVFEIATDMDPAKLRKEIFELSALQRRESNEAFDREAVITQVAKNREITPEKIDKLLYSDLKSAHELMEFKTIDSESLVDLYCRSLGQAVLLKATKVTIWVNSKSPGSYRLLFNKLKFLQLLYTIKPDKKNGYLIEVDGPFSLFTSSTKYGLKLAMLLGALDHCDNWKLEAQILWGKEKRRLDFHLKKDRDNNLQESNQTVADNVQTLVERFEKLKTPWKISTLAEILTLPGEGLCVPDIVFTNKETGEVVYLEVMGFWSRDAIWKRVELVEAGLPYKIIFAVSKKLRVSEEVLGDELPGSLYVYKGVMNPKIIAQMLEDD